MPGRRVILSCLAVVFASTALGVVLSTKRQPPTWFAAPPSSSPTSGISPTPSASPSPLVSPEPPAGPYLAAPANPAQIKVRGAHLFSWTLLDRGTGKFAGSANAATTLNTVESMIKPWIVSDYLRRLAAAGKQPSSQTLNELTLTIIDSNDHLAEKYYRLGGSDNVIRRLISICGLTKVYLKSTLWSWTQMTAASAARYGQCLADGRAAGSQWTWWVLDTMRKVRGRVADQISGAVQGGRWGIIDGLPAELAAETSIKNGWTLYVDGWHVNCLAVHPRFVLAVMIRTYGSLSVAAQACKSVAQQLVVQPAAG